MHDIKAIRDDPPGFDAGLARRGLEPLAESLLRLDQSRREAQTRRDQLLARRNAASRQIGQAKAQRRDADVQALMDEVARLKDELAVTEAGEATAAKALDDALAVIPNLPAAEVPEGRDESGNRELRRWGTPPSFDFKPREHYELGEALGLMDFERAAKLSGARFVVLKGALARLERALAQFMLDLHTGEFGYTEISPPLMVRPRTAFGTGNLPKFRDDLFMLPLEERVFLQDEEVQIVEATRDGKSAYSIRPMADADADTVAWLNEADHLEVVLGKRGPKRVIARKQVALIPTAEVPLTNLAAPMTPGEIIDEATLPHRYTAHTACFRSEAGSAGRDTRGMLRQHQFYKVELISITTPEQSEDEHARMTKAAETVLQRLELPYRVVHLCGGDMGFAARSTYDIEVWLPGQGAFREISSCSNCGEFQARRMNARCRKPGEKGGRFVHTLNGSGIAVGRALIAVMENNQGADGKITIPAALRPYMGGVERIG